MATDPVIRFRFDLAELAPSAPASLTIIDAGAHPLPEGATLVTPPRRPRWLPPLLPVWRAGAPLRLELVAAGSAAFAERLQASLAGIFAAAGAEAGVRVHAWSDGLLVGGHEACSMPWSQPLRIIGAQLTPAALRQAAAALAGGPADRALLALDGDLPSLDAVLELDSWLGDLVRRRRVHRLPLLGKRDLSGLTRGLPPGLASQEYGLACLRLADAAVNAHRELEP